jgi:hypothetical protein
MKQGVNWSALVPNELRPAKIEKAVSEAARLRELLKTEQEALIAATSELQRVEAEDVAALAASFRSGEKAAPRTEQVEQARQDVFEHERRVQAAGEAIAAAEGELGVELQRSRETWGRSVDAAIEQTNASCREHLDGLRSGLQRLAVLRGLSEWLGGDVISPKAARGRGLLHAPSSARAMANGDAVDGQTLLRWAEELIDPPPKRPPVEHQPLVGEAASVA